MAARWKKRMPFPTSQFLDQRTTQSTISFPLTQLPKILSLFYICVPALLFSVSDPRMLLPLWSLASLRSSWYTRPRFSLFRMQNQFAPALMTQVFCHVTGQLWKEAYTWKYFLRFFTQKHGSMLSSIDSASTYFQFLQCFWQFNLEKFFCWKVSFSE